MTSAPKPTIPKAVHNSFVCWIALAVLVVLQFVLRLSVGSFSVPTTIGLALALTAAVGAREMRAGNAWGRMLGAVAGGALGVSQLFGLVLVVGPWVSAGLLGIVLLLPEVVVVGLIVAGMVLMFRPESNVYLRSER